jgi:carbon-monoxide dehydrogenase large subunit
MYDSGDYQGCLDKALAMFDYAARRAEQGQPRNRGRYHRCGGLHRDVRMAPSRRLARSGFDSGG